LNFNHFDDILLGFSYALGAAFAAWTIGQFIRTRQAAMATGAVGSVTFVGVLMAAGYFLIGCCCSPMLGVYLGLFGAKALGIGKPLMAVVTMISVGTGYWYLSRRATKELCIGEGCNCK
jgi:predicted permease